MNQRMPFVWEPAPYLRELISKAQNKQKALRLQLLYLLATQQAASRTQAAALLGLDRETVTSWLTKYEQGGLAALLDMAKPAGLPSSLPAVVIEAMRLKLQDPVGVASFKALHAWVEEQFQLHTSYRIIHYTASQVLGARLAVGRRSHVKKKPVMKRPFAPASKTVYNWRCRRTSPFIGKIRYPRLNRNPGSRSPRRRVCPSRCGRRMKAVWG